MGVAKNLTGQKFGRLTAVSSIRRVSSSGRYIYKCTCICDCGKTALVLAQHLSSGHTKSCGCYNSELMSIRSTTHGKYGTPEHRVWISMNERCANPNHGGYADYGGRGIKVCDRWRGENGFENFLADIGEKPSKGHSIDRIDTNGNYEPSNCKWSTRLEQNNNKRSNVILEYNGVRQNITQWANQIGMKPLTLRARIFEYGWTVEKAITTKLKN